MNVTCFLFSSPYNVLIVFPIIVAVYVLYRHMHKSKPHQINITLDMLLYISGITILLGTLGFFLEMNRATCDQFLPGSSFVTIITTVPESAEQITTMATCYGKSTSAMLTGLLSSMVIAIVWYVLSNREPRT